MSVLDQSADVSQRELYYYAKLYELPAYVKNAAVEELCRPQGLASTAYADVRNRQFPIHTKAATYLSTLFFMEKSASVPSKFRGLIEQRLQDHVNYWGIGGDVTLLRAKHAALHSDELGALPDSSFAIVWADDNGRKERYYPLRNAAEVKQAAEWFSSYNQQLRQSYAFEDRRTIAGKILEKAAQFGAAIGDHSDMLEQQAGHGVCDPKKAAGHIRDRVKAATVNPALQAGMLKLANMFEANPLVTMDPEALAQMAATVDKFDRTNGLLLKYGEHIPSPEEIFFSANLKTAAAFVEESCSTVTGSVYNRKDFSKIALGDIRSLFGTDIAESVADGIMIDPVKAAEVFSTLPRPDAKMLDRLMADHNVRPTIKQASPAVRFSEEELDKLAEFHRRIAPVGAV